MKRIYTYLISFVLIYNAASGQGNGIRGMYIDHFNDIVGNTVKEDSLLQFALDSSYNYFALYSLQSLNLQNTSTANSVAAFIKNARENYGIIYVGAVCETYSTFETKIAPYNANRSDDHEKFNVFNLEFEFWTSSSVGSGGYYCTRYLQQANCSCDTSGGFKFFIEQIHKIDSLAATQQVISETYLGWFNQGQAQQIQQNVDRILLHAYRTNSSSLFSYSKTRLSYLASNHTPVEIAPIFSSEPDFMGTWLETHSQLDAYDQYQTDFDNDVNSWKQYINIAGYHWFTWRFMPKPAPGSSGNFNPTITSTGSSTICAGNSVTLTVTHGDSYNWSNGASTASISVNTAGSYTCSVTLNGNTVAAPAVTVTVNNIPTVTITPGSLNSGIITLTANAAPGSGTITGYQWKLNSGNISGATASTYGAAASGYYTVEANNSNGCIGTSAPESVIIQGTCVMSTPSGLSSIPASGTSQVLNWLPGQTGDSLIIRYHPDGTSTYDYIRLENRGQTTYTLTGLLPNTLYSWRVKTICGTTSGSYSNNELFMTGSVGINDAPLTTEGVLKMYPNPVKNNVQVDFSSSINITGKLSISDINGRIVLEKTLYITKGDNKIDLSLSELNNGIYCLTVMNYENVMIEKLIVSH